MSTAPHDGTEILVIMRDVDFYQIVGWDADATPPRQWKAPDGPRYHRDAFAFWMPLPRPPRR